MIPVMQSTIKAVRKMWRIAYADALASEPRVGTSPTLTAAISKRNARKAANCEAIKKTSRLLERLEAIRLPKASSPGFERVPDSSVLALASRAFLGEGPW